MKKDGVLRWTLKLIKPWIPALILLVALNVLHAVLTVWYSLGYREVIDSVTRQGATSEAFIKACIQQGILVVAIVLCGPLSHHVLERIRESMDKAIKKRMLHGLLRGEYAAISKYHTGSLLSLMNHDLNALIGNILNILPAVASMSAKLVSVLTVLIALEPQLAYVVLLGGGLVVLVTGIIRRNLKALNKKASRIQGKVSGFIQETLEKLLMVQAMDISEVMEKRADALLQKRFEIHRKRKNVGLISRTCMVAMAYGSAFGAMVFCAGGILNGTMTYGTLLAITQLVSQIRGPITHMSGISPQYAALSAAAERLMELDAVCDTTPVERKDTAALYESMTAIRAEALTFAYDRDYIFENADFTLPKGSFGVIVGHSGIGKSTLLKLLLGIFPLESGQLVIDSPEGAVPVDRTTRRLFAYVPQGNLLLSGTLRDNLLVTNQNATQEEIDRAIYISAMDAYLPTLPEGLDTVVGENAMGLSEGQAQRLSIARAILSDAPILLLDEATSALDDATEKAVLQRIKALPGKTCIAVTHRAAATQMADWSLQMGEGKCTLQFK